MPEMTAEARLTVAQDVLDVISRQRDDAFNTIAQIGAQLKAANRKIAELEAKLVHSSGRRNKGKSS